MLSKNTTARHSAGLIASGVSLCYPAFCNSLSDLSVEATRRLCFLCRLRVRISSPV